MTLLRHPDIVITGGQTGADKGGLLGARDVGIRTGGFAPLGWRTEVGPEPSLGSDFGLTQSGSASYRARTVKNVRRATAVAIFWIGGPGPGSRTTLAACETYGIPVVVNPDPDELVDFFDRAVADRKGAFGAPAVLNVTGGRESANRGIVELVRKTIAIAFAPEINEACVCGRPRNAHRWLEKDPVVDETAAAVWGKDCMKFVRAFPRKASWGVLGEAGKWIV